MKKNLFAAVCAMLVLTGCSSNIKALSGSAAGKNLDISGYVMSGKIEGLNAETPLPHGSIIMGRVSYKSRKVSVPAQDKVPTAAYFKALTTETFLGTRESVIEYDFTASTAKDAAILAETMQKQLLSVKEVQQDKNITVNQ